MNTNGQTVMLSIIFAFFIFLFGMLIFNFIKGEITNTRTDLSCSGTISDGTKLTCLIVDGTIPYFILLVLSISGGTILNRLLV